MQPTDSQVSVVENKTIESADWLRTMPVELTNVIPESVWSTLTVEQKKDTLRQHAGLYEKYVGVVEVKPLNQSIENSGVEDEARQVVVEQEQRIEKNPEFEKALQDFKTVESNQETDPKPAVLSKEEISRIEEEKAQSASVKTYQFFGYQPSQTTVTNASQVSNTGPVSDAKTWASTMIARIFEIFG